MGAWERATAVPAARSDGLLIQPVGDETVIYDRESKQAHCLKPLAAFVFESSDGHATVGEIAMTATQRLGHAVSDADIADAVSQLESVGLLQTVLVVRTSDQFAVSNDNAVSRRDMIRRVGFAGAAAAAATSLITSIAPSPALARSGIPAGCTGCAANAECVSGHCCQSAPGKTCNASCCVGANNSCHAVCTCVGGARGGNACDTQTCPGGTCKCVCSVCSADVPGGTCPSCPNGTVSCCSLAACSQAIL